MEASRPTQPVSFTRQSLRTPRLRSSLTECGKPPTTILTACATRHTASSRHGCGSKNTYPKWSPGKLNQGLKPASPGVILTHPPINIQAHTSVPPFPFPQWRAELQQQPMHPLHGNSFQICKLQEHGIKELNLETWKAASSEA